MFISSVKTKKRSMSINRSFDDPAARKAQESMQGGAADYIFFPGVHQRGSFCSTTEGRGSVCQSYVNIVTRDSWLSGRGQPLSNAPESEVRWLPEDLFGPNSSNNAPSVHENPRQTHTRQPRSCASVTNIDVGQFSLMPRVTEDNFSGLRLEMMGEQSRDMLRAHDMQQKEATRAAQKGKTSYGWYPPTSVVRRR